MSRSQPILDFATENQAIAIYERLIDETKDNLFGPMPGLKREQEVEEWGHPHRRFAVPPLK